MKKNIYKTLAATFALALVAASPATAITTHAAGFGFNPHAHDYTDRGTMPDDYWTKLTDGSNDCSSSSSTPTPAPTPKAEDSGSGNSGSSCGSGSGFNNDAHDDTNRGEMPSDYWSTMSNPNDVTVSVTGGQKFRSVMNVDHTVYQIYHCGISRVSFTVTDAKGNAIAFDTVTLEQSEDGLWYESITLAEGIDTKGLTVTATKGDASYLTTNLGVSGIKLNGTVMLLTDPATDTK